MTDKITTLAWNKADVKLYLYNLDQALLVQSIIVTKLKLWELIKDPVNKIPYWVIQVKEEGWTGFSEGWQDCSEGFPEGEARGKSRGAALPAQGKPSPSRLFYLDLHSI